MRSSELSRTSDISLAALFGAMIALSYLIPVSIVIGGVGVFNLAWVVQTLAGILLGPYIGGGAAMAGGLIGEVMVPSPFGILGFMRPALAALQAGLIVWGRWDVAAIIIVSLMVIWFLLPIALIVWPMAIFFILGLVLVVTFGKTLPSAIRESRVRRRIFVGWLLVAYCANITRHMLGDIWLAVLLLPPYYFWAALPATAIEQSMFALASAIVGVSTLVAVRKAGFDIPLTRLDQIPKLAHEGEP